MGEVSPLPVCVCWDHLKIFPLKLVAPKKEKRKVCPIPWALLFFGVLGVDEKGWRARCLWRPRDERRVLRVGRDYCVWSLLRHLRTWSRDRAIDPIPLCRR